MKPKINYKLSDFPFNHNLKTRWRDLDAFQHINNATILSYMEDARVALFTQPVNGFATFVKIIDFAADKPTADTGHQCLPFGIANNSNFAEFTAMA